MDPVAHAPESILSQRPRGQATGHRSAADKRPASGGDKQRSSGLHSPTPSTSEGSDSSMHDVVDGLDVDPCRSSSVTATADIRQLTLESRDRPESVPKLESTRPKRSASREHERRSIRQRTPPSYERLKGLRVPSKPPLFASPRPFSIDLKSQRVFPSSQYVGYSLPRQLDPSRKDSGYETRQNTIDSPNAWPSAPPVIGLFSEDLGAGRCQKFSLTTQPSTMFKQPDTTHITQEQLAAEVRGIYTGLVMVEAKSINIDTQAADPKTTYTPEQWQALIALRRTLLYEHHDFLMATQHPAANPTLRGLAAKYCMPARLWKHGIHGFLEVLRHRRPESQEYMLTFIYLAYDMVALLYETVPAFTDTWIECLGDLARYRMAIEEDKEVHAAWGEVAAMWYSKSADRHPQIGRLAHHLGILQRPSLKKFYFYSKALTSVIPFVNARESFGTLCAPILQDDQAFRCGAHSAEAMTICYHARVFTDHEPAAIERDGRKALELLNSQTPGKIASYGTPLAVTNIAALFQFGMPNNVFKQIFAEALERDAHAARPSSINNNNNNQYTSMSEAAQAIHDSEAFNMTTYPSDFVIEFFATCFNDIVSRKLDQPTIRDLAQYVNVNMVFLNSLFDIRAGGGLSSSQTSLVDKVLSSIKWTALVDFLNELSSIDSISTRLEEHAIGTVFLIPERIVDRKPLAEDYQIRGISWAPDRYLPTELFIGIEDDDGSRWLETPSRLHLRAERVEWSGVLLAHPSKLSPVLYHRTTRQFSTLPYGSAHPKDYWSIYSRSGYESISPTSSWSSNTLSGRSSMDTGSCKVVSVQSDLGTVLTPSEDSQPRTNALYEDAFSVRSHRYNRRASRPQQSARRRSYVTSHKSTTSSIESPMVEVNQYPG